MINLIGSIVFCSAGVLIAVPIVLFLAISGLLILFIFVILCFGRFDFSEDILNLIGDLSKFIDKLLLKVLQKYKDIALFIMTPILNFLQMVLCPILQLVLSPILHMVRFIYYFCIFYKIKLTMRLDERNASYYFKYKNQDLLRCAAENRHLNIVKLLKAGKVDIHTRMHDGTYALYYAIKNKHLNLVKFLLAEDPCFEKRASADMLKKAIKVNHVNILNLLLNAMPDSDIVEATRKYGRVFMSPVVLNFRLGKLAWPMLQNITSLLKMMKITKGENIVDSNIILYQIMPMIASKPDWCPEKVYQNLCVRILKLAQEKVAKQQKSKVQNTKSTEVITTLTTDKQHELHAISEPVIFTAYCKAANEVMSVKVRPIPAAKTLNSSVIR